MTGPVAYRGSHFEFIYKKKNNNNNSSLTNEIYCVGARGQKVSRRAEENHGTRAQFSRDPRPRGRDRDRHGRVGGARSSPPRARAQRENTYSV